jgi:hypothetical protein
MIKVQSKESKQAQEAHFTGTYQWIAEYYSSGPQLKYTITFSIGGLQLNTRLK